VSPWTTQLLLSRLDAPDLASDPLLTPPRNPADSPRRVRYRQSRRAGRSRLSSRGARRALRVSQPTGCPKGGAMCESAEAANVFVTGDFLKNAEGRKLFGRREAKPRRGEDRKRAGRINFRTIPARGGNRSVPGRSVCGRPRDPSANTHVSFFGFQSCSCCPKKQVHFRESNKKCSLEQFLFSWKLCT
jgi:hypothetical protein